MSSATRGLCPVCDRWMLIKADGTLRHHGGPIGTGLWPERRAYHCDGAGQIPTESREETRNAG